LERSCVRSLAQDSIDPLGALDGAIGALRDPKGNAQNSAQNHVKKPTSNNLGALPSLKTPIDWLTVTFNLSLSTELFGEYQV
jgi:hypothetical protein